jgi:hypothetical protein
MSLLEAGGRRLRPRDRVISHLKAVGEVRDPGGLASTALAEAVSYPGSSVAFAQLLSAMERSGLIEREIRGRRTYRIRLADAATARARDPEPGDVGLDYDKLARRLLIELVRRLTVAPGDLAGTSDLAETVASLERRLASVESRQRRLLAENTRLRELLAAARQSLTEQQHIPDSSEPAAYLGQLDAEAVQILERLLSSLRGGAARGESAQAG